MRLRPRRPLPPRQRLSRKKNRDPLSFERQITPASIWRAFFSIASAAILAPLPSQAQRGPQAPPPLVQLGEPDQAEGQRILEQFRGLGLAGDYYLEFQLRVMPRRGRDRVYRGEMWGALGSRGPVSRVSFSADGVEHRLLVRDGPEPAVWHWRSGAAAQAKKLGVADLFAPLAQTDLTPFDLGRPYLYWPDFAYEGIVRMRGRPAHRFLLRPPADFAASYPALTGVRVYLDAQFKALVQSEQLGARGRLLRSMSVLELKKIGDQWIVKSIDLRDETTHNKTRFSVVGAALEQEFDEALFAPSALAENGRPPASNRVTKIDP